MKRSNIATIVTAAAIAASSLTIGSSGSRQMPDYDSRGMTDAIADTVIADTITHMPSANYVPTILIDPGHDSKNIGWPDKRPTKSKKEEELNLEFAKLLRDSLMANGYRVILTRDSTVGLNTKNLNLNGDRVIDKKDEILARSHFIDSINPDLSISIHYNANRNSRDPDWSEVFFFGVPKRQYRGKLPWSDPKLYRKHSETSKDIAKMFSDYLNGSGRKTIMKAADFIIFDEKIPRNMILFEVAYLTTNSDAKRWASRDGEIEMVDHIKRFLVDNKDYIAHLNSDMQKKRDLFYIRPVPKENLVFLINDILQEEMKTKQDTITAYVHK